MWPDGGFAKLFNIDTNTNKTFNIEEMYNKLIILVTNFDQDIVCMKDVLGKINNWITDGISSLNTCVSPLAEQIKQWEDKMEHFLESFKNNITELKLVDDRINNTIEINIEDTDYDNCIDRWKHYNSLHSALYHNLQDDIKILQNVTNDLSNYTNLGVELGNSLEKINEQKQNIETAITNSLDKYKQLILLIENEAIKIKNNSEL